MTTGSGDLPGAKAVGEFLGRQAVIGQFCRVEAVGLDFFIAQAGNSGEGAVDIGPHRGPNREELKAHLELLLLRGHGKGIRGSGRRLPGGTFVG